MPLEHREQFATFTFHPLPLIVAEGDEPRQVCRLTVHDLPAATGAMLHVRRGDLDRSVSLDLPAGTSNHEILLPEVAEPRSASVELTAGDRHRESEVSFAPVRRWQVFFVNHSHTDIGFTHTPSAVVDVHNKNLERALEFAAATADWPSDARYRWTCEAAWQVQNYLRARPEDRLRLIEAIQDGSVEVEALYIHSYFDLLSREQLVRSLSYAQQMRNELGAPITSAMICDVPGCAWSLVDLAAAAGVRYLAMAPNNFLAPFHATTDLPRPFIWQGPAGGRVLVWYTDDPFWAYIEGARHGFWQGLEQVEEKLPAKLAQLEAKGYPFDAVQIQLGSDNRPLRLLPATIAREWNRKYLSPRIRIATPSTFFRHAEEHWSDQLPVVTGEWQSSWSQTTLHYPQEAAASRRNHAILDLWERLAVVADWINEAYVYPRATLAATYDASLLFDEHSGPKGIWLPHSEDEADQALREGFQIFEEATLPARDGLAAALSSATGALKGGDAPAAVVWNLLSWPRGGTIDVNVPAAWIGPETAVVDEVTGQPVAFEMCEPAGDETRCRIQTADVPAMGYKRYLFTSGDDRQPHQAGSTPAVRVSGDAAVLENDRFALSIDETGGISSLVDVQSGAEFVDRSSWPGLNALVRYVADPHGPEPGGDFTADKRLYEGTPIGGHVVTPTSVQTEAITTDRGFDRTTVTTATVFDDLYQWRSEVSLYTDWVEVTNRLSWLDRPADPEMLYVLFPFALSAPHIRHAAQHAIIDPRTQTLSGSSLDSFAIQHWLDLSRDDRGVTLCSADLALADYGGINVQRFLRRLDPATGTVAFRAASGRALPPRDVDPFGRRECLEMRFAIRPYRRAFDPLAAHRFGESWALPLQAATLPAKHPGFWTEATGSFVDLQSSSVMLTALKRADFADGYVVRVGESAGRRSFARLTFPHHTLLAAWAVTPVEAEIGRLEPIDGQLRFELAPFQTATFRCVLGR
ncbi:MAG: glycosyl hydrolase-related protein [Thermomicrobiales bacterium]